MKHNALTIQLILLVIAFSAQPVLAGPLFHEGFNGSFSNSWDSTAGVLPTESLAPVRSYGIPHIGAPGYSFDTVDGAGVIVMNSTLVPINSRLGFLSNSTISGTIGEVEARINTLDQGGLNIDGLFDLWLVSATDSTKFVRVGLFGNFFDTQRIWTSSTSQADFDESGLSYLSNTWYKLRITQVEGSNLKVSVWNDAGDTQLVSRTFNHNLEALGDEFRVGFSQWMGRVDGTHSLLSAVDYIRADISVVPEPSTFALLGIGGLALVGYGWRRKRQQAA